MMRWLAWSLLVAGTIVGTLGGARLPEANWVVAGIGFAMLAIAAVVLRFVIKSATGAAGNGRDVLAAMRQLPERLDALVRDAPSLALSEIAARLAALDRDLFKPIAEGAPRLLRTMGTDGYADVFGTYAGGERSIARAWSAASDHHRPETLASLELGAVRIRDAIRRLDARSPSGAPAAS